MRIQKPQDAAESVNSVLAGDNQPIAGLVLLHKTWVASSTIIHHPPSASVASVCTRGSPLTDIYMTRSVKLDKERIQSNQLCCWPPHLPHGHAQRWASITLLLGLPWTMPGKVCFWSFITTRKTQFISDMSEFLLGPECIPASTAISGQCFSDRHRILPTSSDHQSLQQLQYVGTHEATALFIPPPSKAVCFEKSLCEAGKVMLERFFKALKMEAEGADGLGHQSHCHLLSYPVLRKRKVFLRLSSPYLSRTCGWAVVTAQCVPVSPACETLQRSFCAGRDQEAPRFPGRVQGLGPLLPG